MVEPEPNVPCVATKCLKSDKVNVVDWVLETELNKCAVFVTSLWICPS